MPVVDASVFVDSLVSIGAPGQRARAELRQVAALQVPAIFRAEVVSALRSLLRRGAVSVDDAAFSVETLRSTRMMEYPFAPFMDRAWELRDRLTVYDAWYVALAERLVTDLITADGRLATVRGLRCAVRLPG